MASHKKKKEIKLIFFFFFFEKMKNWVWEWVSDRSVSWKIHLTSTEKLDCVYVCVSCAIGLLVVDITGGAEKRMVWHQKATIRRGEFFCSVKSYVSLFSPPISHFYWFDLAYWTLLSLSFPCGNYGAWEKKNTSSSDGIHFCSKSRVKLSYNNVMVKTTLDFYLKGLILRRKVVRSCSFVLRKAGFKWKTKLD